MISTNLQAVAEQVVRLALRQGYVTAGEVRQELAQAGHPEALWKDVLALARPSLSYRGGRYHYAPPVSARVRVEQSQQRDIHRAVSGLIREHQSAVARVERRGQERLDFIHPVKVRTEDQREFTLLSRDLSPSGIRLLGTRRLLGQKVHVRLPGADGASWEFQVRILWTCPVGDDLVENGGMFLSVSPSAASPSV
jgi:hypothetical protein